MPESMGNSRTLLAMCIKAAEGGLDEGQQSALVSQVVGSFATMPVVGSNIVRMARRRDWYGLIGAIGCFIDVSEASSDTVTVKATASAEATLTLDMSVFFSAEDAISSDPGLTEAGRSELIGLLREIASSAQRKDAVTVSDKLRQFLEDGANVVTVMTWLGPILTQVGLMLAG